MAAILAGNGEDKKPLEAVTDAKEMADLHRLSQNQGLYDESDRKRPWDSGMKNSSSFNSEESALDCDPSHFEGNRACEALIESTSMQAAASGGQPSESNAAYFHWPPPHGEDEYAEDRHKFFEGLQKGTNTSVESCQQATILLDLMMIRAYNSKQLRRFSLATAIGFRTRKGILTDIPAIIVFVAHKVHHEWLHDVERLPSKIMGPGGIWCDVDVVEFSYYTTPTIIPKQPVYSELAERLQGNDPTIGPGSQVANQETFGTLGAIVQSRTGNHQVGFLTNRHVAVNLDYPNQKMFHPLPPNLGPGVYLGAVERATSFITDDVWYNIFTSLNPETFVRADGAFIPFRDNFDMKCVVTEVKGLGEMGDVMMIDLQKPIGTVVGQEVVKVGRSSGLTTGRIMAYALEYNDERGICFFTDFLIVGKDKQTFDLEGDSGSLILMSGDKPRPVGIIWGGTANRGRLKLHSGHEPENWTTGVDLGRLLELLQLDLITNNEMLQEAMRGQRCSIFESCSEVTQLTEPPQKPDIAYEDRQCQCSGASKNHHLIEEQEEGGVEPVITHHRPDLKLINFVFSSPPPVDIQNENQTSPTDNNTTESLSFGLDSFEREAKRRKS